MNYSEKNGQPSMEEILASIRRIIADEPQGASPIIDLRGTSRPLNLLSTDEDDSPDFQLPSIFRPQPTPEKPAPLFGRLTDAIRQASGSTEARPQDAAFDPYIASVAQPGAVNGTATHGLSTLNVQRPVQASDFAHVTQTRPVQPVEPVVEEPARAEQTSTWWGGSSTPRPPQAAESDVKREMVPFRDTRMAGMGSVAVYHPEEFATPPAAAVEPAPAATSAPMQNASPSIDFSAIVPGQQDAPAPAHMAIELWREPAPATPMPPYMDAAVDGVAPPPLPAAGAFQKSGSAAPSGTIEDATADLLRPMLRQWLAENMPRMVEKALHIEVAQSVRPVKKPQGQ